ncbi:MAG: DUF4381 domain-containing protein [Alphaproteobacteria bacterium]|nr:DUF4381 domain-containing protein [Alphaproteobacteria bacterium]
MPDNLPELKDIHLPDGVSIFPLAYGWWVILAAVIVLWCGIKLFILLRQKSKKLFAERFLRKISLQNPVIAVTQMSELLRRVCVSKYPAAAVLSGTEWISFLKSKTQSKLSEKEESLLQNAPYMDVTAGGYSDKNAEAIKIFCQKWIGENL